MILSPPQGCERNIDCVFILDQSGSVGRTNHGTAIRFIKNVVNYFTIGEDNTRVGFVAYEGSAHIEFDLNDHLTQQSLIEAIDNIRYRGGGTRTGRALTSANTILLPSNNRGARSSSEGIPKIAILITDGHSFDDVRAPAVALKNAGVQVYAIGIGNYRLSELQDIASDPDDRHVFLLSSYNDALGFVDSMSVTTCQSPAIVTPCVLTSSSVPENTLTYFQSSCSSFSTSVIVEVTGSVSLFCSTSATNPGPLTTDTQEITSTASPKRCTLTGSNTVYFGVQGQARGDNHFSLVVNEDIFRVLSVDVNMIRGETGLIYDVSRNIRNSNRVTYMISDGNTGNSFRIYSDGRITAVSPSQLRIHSTFTLSVVAKRSSRNCNCARMAVNIRVLSNEVTFTTPQLDRVTIPEDASLGHLVETVATDGSAGQVSFSIESGNVGSGFTIGSSTGQIRVASGLDYETRDSYTLRIRARSTLNSLITGTVDLTVAISDVNEEPYFNPPCEQACIFTIREDVAVNSRVGTVAASDPDRPISNNGRLGYTLPAGSPFSIDSNGNIATSSMLDFEAAGSHNFEVQVSDMCPGCSLSSRTAITVRVTDVNDNAPVIRGRSVVMVNENIGLNSIVAQYSATDADSGSNAVIVFSIVSSGNEPFQIDDENGNLKVSGQIDYERQQDYTITIRASNPGTSLSSSITVNIRVINQNDERPVFSGDYSVNVTEHSAMGTAVVTLSATDADLDSFGEVRYSITSGNLDNSFSLNQESGVITVAADIDRESVSSFNLVVSARDMGTPRPLVATTTVSIRVLDINDNTPVFSPEAYSIPLREDTSVGTALFSVYATDADQPGNPNSVIDYQISSGNPSSTFSIDQSTGLISLNGSLDFETVPDYQLTVTAEDQGSPTMSSRADVVITVENVNESPPSVSGNQTVSISENAPPGIAIADFDAVDSDQTAVSFMLGRGNLEQKFEINTHGTVNLLSSLDYETREQYIVEVIVSDGDNEVTRWLTVNVLDVNEFTPEFFGPTDFSIEEEQPSGTVVGQVQAMDRDGSSDSMITYSFSQRSTYFTIDSDTGRITTAAELDREQLSHVFTPPSSQQRLTVIARDQGNPSRQNLTTITITLNDINDNDPTLANAYYEKSLLENLPAGQTVFDFEASDLDLGSNGDLYYSFELIHPRHLSGLFSINEVSGVLKTTQSLDRENQAIYNFTLKVRDKGRPSRETTSSGVLYTIDENDNIPEFTATPYIVSVSEGVETDSTVHTVLAEDPDEGSNGNVTFSLVNVNELLTGSEDSESGLPYFEIDSVSGAIVIKTGFDFEREQSVNVTVTASDGGVPRLSSTAVVSFIVTNVDEEGPQFIDDCSFTISEDTPINTIIGQCIAVDRDYIRAAGNAVTYGLHGNNEIIQINPTTGEITLSRNLDYELASRHVVSIEAVDQSGESNFKKIEITVADANDNPPQFSKPVYSVDLSSQDIRSQSRDLLVITANDLDENENGLVSYHLERVIQQELVTVLEINATDHGSPALFSVSNVTVNFDQPCLLQRYTIEEFNGTVLVDFLCSVEISPSSLIVSLGGSSTVQCSVLYVGDLSFQWIHNGSLISKPTVLSNRLAAVSYTLIDARFDDSGEYACKVTTAAGSLQSVAARASVLVPPVITVPPRDQAAKEGGEVVFTCSATGIPDPTIEWFFEETTKLPQNESTLRVPDVTVDKEGTYKCLASNSPHTSTMASAKLTIYENKHVVQLRLDHISNPSPDGTCHFIDYNKISDALKAITRIQPLIVGTEGDGICEQTPCSPSPCRNGGECVLDDQGIGGYHCDCPRGFIGRNCTEDNQECLTNPCENNGTCNEQVGSYLCHCAMGFSGRRCQFQVSCVVNNCSGGSLCFDTQSGEYVCRELPESESSVVVTGLDSENVELIDDYLQTYLERISSSTSGSRNRRNVQFTTICEPRFVELMQRADSYVLIWICPSGEEQPSNQDEASLCDPLLNSGYIQTCKPPHGEPRRLTQPETPPDTSAVVDIILIKQTSKVPLDGDIVVRELKKLRSRAAEVGLDVSQISAPESQSPTQNQPDSAGVVAGVLLVICLIVLGIVVIVVIVILKKRRQGKLSITREQTRELVSGQEDGELNAQPSTQDNDKEDLSPSGPETFSRVEQSTYDRLGHTNVYVQGECDSASDEEQ